jgi:hypothetical protein
MLSRIETPIARMTGGMFDQGEARGSFYNITHPHTDKKVEYSGRIGIIVVRGLTIKQITMEIENYTWANKQWVEKRNSVSKKTVKIIGVYAIEFPDLNKVYVGQSVNIRSRWSQHRSVLRKRSSENRSLQEAWNNGVAIFVIVEQCDRSVLREREKEIAMDYVGRGWELINEVFLLKPTSVIIDEDFKDVLVRLNKLLSQNRITVAQLESAIENL